jgi:hypothetical protein
LAWISGKSGIGREEGERRGGGGRRGEERGGERSAQFPEGGKLGEEGGNREGEERRRRGRRNASKSPIRERRKDKSEERAEGGRMQAKP